MPGKKDAAYWADYRKRKAAAAAGDHYQPVVNTVDLATTEAHQISEVRLLEVSVVKDPPHPSWRSELKEKPARIATSYVCGCEELRCMSHAIAALSQDQRDRILDAMKKGKKE